MFWYLDFPPSFESVWFDLLCGLLVGLVLGSFITMLSYRLPRHLSILFPRSRCPNCQTPLKIRDLVPVISWLAARGTCRYCGIKISARYVWIELATAAGCMALFGLIGMKPIMIAALGCVIAIITSVTIIIERMDD